ncbi:hypothetical protein MWU75_10150 [Ornithinimicrobium sp. F0845]|uniref:hypothetical protein n=1 Tax=Ornithinimicrobium sp. F0845 TaxID=2926412 RepID=UPI001FF4E48E|nr:hypothetical protein [Ornithinimicrobium sp. F0845]MCK0112499.1 hypothetical protein [Ornithinimicrobium sp. F0845]
MAVVTTLPHGRALRVRDLESIHDDGHRYELIDGSLDSVGDADHAFSHPFTVTVSPKALVTR